MKCDLFPKLVSRQNATYPSRHEKAFGFVREGINLLKVYPLISTMEIIIENFALFRVYE